MKMTRDEEGNHIQALCAGRLYRGRINQSVPDTREWSGTGFLRFARDDRTSGLWCTSCTGAQRQSQSEYQAVHAGTHAGRILSQMNRRSQERIRGHKGSNTTMAKFVACATVLESLL